LKHKRQDSILRIQILNKENEGKEKTEQQGKLCSCPNDKVRKNKIENIICGTEAKYIL
jgi:hypothetical protein